MTRKSCHKGVKLTCGEVYERIAKSVKSKYHEDAVDVYQYENGAIGVFLKSGKFRFVQGSNPDTLAKLRSKRTSRKSSKTQSKKMHSKKRQTGGQSSCQAGGKKKDEEMHEMEEMTMETQPMMDMESMQGGSKKRLSLKGAVQLLRKYYSQKYRK
jgi:hypothetical protein